MATWKATLGHLDDALKALVQANPGSLGHAVRRSTHYQPLQHRHTADIYTSVLPETAHRAAQATADVIIEAARNIIGSRLGASA